jgi:hypothetical protein
MTSTAFPVTSTAVAAPTTVTITATAFGTSTVTATITVTPGTPPAADAVHVTKGTWKARLLTIEATSSNPNAILSVFSSDGAFMFTLTNVGGGRYQDSRGWVFNPVQITVYSNFGGADTVTLAS